MESLWNLDMQVEKYDGYRSVFHRVLAMWKREISLPVGSETAKR